MLAMDNELIMYAGEIYNPLAESEEKTVKYYVDRWGTVYSRNPKLEEEAPEKEPTSSSGWEEDRR